MRRRTLLIVSALLVALSAACGGGDDNDNPTAGPLTVDHAEDFMQHLMDSAQRQQTSRVVDLVTTQQVGVVPRADWERCIGDQQMLTIGGNKVDIEDAYEDTLQIQGQPVEAVAVTVDFGQNFFRTYHVIEEGEQLRWALAPADFEGFNGGGCPTFWPNT